MILSLLLSCRPGDVAPAHPEFELTLSEQIGTVARVRFTTEDRVPAVVRFGPSLDDLRYEAWSEDPRTEHTVLLAGMRGSETYHFQLVTEDGVLREGRFTTGPVPSELDVFSNTGPAHDARGFVVATLISFPCSAVIVDEEGHVVWWHTEEDPDLIITRARLSHDGRSVLYDAYDPSPGEGEARHEIVRVALDGRGLQRLPLPDLHHDFVELPDDQGFAYLGVDPRIPEGAEGAIKGDELVERLPDGSLRQVWSAWDTFEWDPELDIDAGTWWSHANAVDYVPFDDTYLVGLRNFDAIVKIQRATGEVVWVLGGRDSDFEITGRPTRHQHQFQTLHDGGLLVFDNGSVENLASRAVEFVLDDEGMTATQVWDYWGDEDLYSFGLGSVQRVQEDHTMVTWSTAGRVEEVDPGGDVVWRLETELGTGVGYTTWLEDLQPGNPDLFAR